ncbi:MAG: AAA family ATPase, CDC48 subfamily [Methanomicrobiales archaeon 53_19]|jgi:transitional endoplasmic reticulum ATPase|uniref:CDC48 family AAA ATPase n=1 Tax=Methanocalculus sp. TaxID=2004547 RepID=UPI00074B1920|nr:CDC48 family AAA ATPase [Methanocalculus sp.]KUK70162.1 MAG: AAA family ATPase, CDC48 subfamily [Methanocalculus sp. 52_23]KUL03435.1 MAG: AAA family ATPase, CDC48 subfamily [Methanomicrobiales archaeon 53_19]HIJ07704.1 CDC48 family AAA ATPase [Methanocalculus sp.]
MTTDKDYMDLVVKEAAHGDAGRGMARLSIDVMKQLNLVSGDVIEISGKKKAAAIVWPGFPEDTGRAVIRIDGNIRSNAGAGIDDKVRIRKLEAGYATKVVIQPTQPIRLVGGEQYLKRMLHGRSVSAGQTVRVNVLGNPLTFVISKVSPKGIAIVTEDTEIELKETPYVGEKGKEGFPDIHYEDIGGLGRELQLVREMIELPLRHPELFERLGIEPPKGVLLYGPPGTGKTLIARAVASEVDAHFITLSGPEIMSKYYGESEGKLREVFDEAQENSPTIIFIDEIDSIAPKREDTKGEVERRVVAQLLSLMDGLKSRGQVIVIAATNLPDAIDPALRRGGRFDREIEIGIPDKKGRLEILQIHSRGVPLAEDVELSHFADITHGFVGADLSLLVKEAAMHALRKIIPKINVDEDIPTELLDELKVVREDFDEALKHVEPSAMREVLVEVPDVHWSDIGGLVEVKEELREAVEWPLKYPDIFHRLTTKPPKGILLFGPPGTGKTLLAKAVANESESNFISIKGPELLSKWVGESEKGVREIFRKARQASPSIIFFDEVDALVPRRGSYAGSSHVTESVVSQILTEIDGLEELKDVVVIGATNRPDMMDTALMRPGRLERHIFVPPPDEEGRRQIFKVYLKDEEGLLAKDIDLDTLVAETKGFVGADIEALVREAKLYAIRDFISKMGGRSEIEVKDAMANIRVTKEHVRRAQERVKPSLDSDAIESAERQSWEFLYNEEQRRVLEKALNVAKRALLMEKNEALTASAKALRDHITASRKQFDVIRERTTELEKLMTEEK